jgi:hypothetical protein
VNYLVESVGIDQALAEAVVNVCIQKNVVTTDGAVDLELTRQSLLYLLDESFAKSQMKDGNDSQQEQITDAILKSRYRNLDSLLRNHVSKSTYLYIVRTKVLVDVQGDDLLYQIFCM